MPFEDAISTGRIRRCRTSFAALVVAPLSVAVACAGTGSEAAEPTDAAPLGEAVALEGAGGVSTVDWEEATYLSVCGLTGVEVRGGVGEASSLGATYGVEIVDADLADLDGDGAEDAAVLVDCLGSDSYSPHVVVVPADGVTDGEVPALAVAAGGALPGGDRPIDIDARADGRIDVEVLDAGRPRAHTLRYAPDVLVGGELPAVPGSVVPGVLSSVSDGVAVVAVSPDAGYRLAVAPGMPVLDPDLGSAVAVESVQGREVAVTIGEGATVLALSVAPAGS